MKLQDASINRGQATRIWARETIQRLKLVADRKRSTPNEVRVLVTPAIQNDEERGEGDSVNSRLHRILRGQQ